MWRSQLVKNTMTEEMRIGSHSDGIETMFPPTDRSYTPGLPTDTGPGLGRGRRIALRPLTREYGTRLRNSGVELAPHCLGSGPGLAPGSVCAPLGRVRARRTKLHPLRRDVAPVAHIRGVRSRVRDKRHLPEIPLLRSWRNPDRS